MKILLLLLLCSLHVYSQKNGLSCIDLYELNIKFDEKRNTPELFRFTHNGKILSENVQILSPILKAIDYDGFVQFKSQNGLHEYRISYIDPGEIKKIDRENIVAVNSLKDKIDSVTYSDMWGSGNLFSKHYLYAKKIQQVRFLIPLIEEKNGFFELVGYACSNWHKLREIDNPAKCYEEKKQRKPQKDIQNKHQKQLVIPNSKFSPKSWEDIDMLLECE